MPDRNMDLYKGRKSNTNKNYAGKYKIVFFQISVNDKWLLKEKIITAYCVAWNIYMRKMYDNNSTEVRRWNGNIPLKIFYTAHDMIWYYL